MDRTDLGQKTAQRLNLDRADSFLGWEYFSALLPVASWLDLFLLKFDELRHGRLVNYDLLEVDGKPRLKRVK